MLQSMQWYIRHFIANSTRINPLTYIYLSVILCTSILLVGPGKKEYFPPKILKYNDQYNDKFQFTLSSSVRFHSAKHQCKVTHSGSLLQYQCNSGPYDNGRTVIVNPVRSSSSYFSVNTWHSSEFILKPEYESSLLKFNSCRRSFSRGPSPAPECSEDLAPNLSFQWIGRELLTVAEQLSISMLSGHPQSHTSFFFLVLNHCYLLCFCCFEEQVDKGYWPRKLFQQIEFYFQKNEFSNLQNQISPFTMHQFMQFIQLTQQTNKQEFPYNILHKQSHHII